MTSTEEEEEKEGDHDEDKDPNDPESFASSSSCSDGCSTIQEQNPIGIVDKDEEEESGSDTHHNNTSVVDLTMSPQRSPVNKRKRSSVTCIEDQNEEIERLRTIAKKYKRKFQQKDSQFRDHFQQQSSLRDQLFTTKEELKDAQSELDDVEKANERIQLELDGHQVKAIRLEQEKQAVSKSFKDLQKQFNTVNQDYMSLKTNYKRDLERARTGPVEMKNILVEYPKLIQQNKDLKEKLSKFERQKSSESRRPSIVAASSKPSSSVIKTLKQLAKANSRGSSSIETSSSHQRASAEPQVSSASLSGGNYSSQTARIAQDFKKKKAMQARKVEAQSNSSEAASMPLSTGLFSRGNSLTRRNRTPESRPRSTTSFGQRSLSDATNTTSARRNQSTALSSLNAVAHTKKKLFLRR